ncbi:MAG TPA: hypothetical protein VHQ00_02865, partial [Chloroflexota bacterium]|nr:hypothetical protein [Chloroflexota bacterium]
AIPAAERYLDGAALRFEHAPPWVDEHAVRRMLERVTGRVLPPDGMWPVELAYARNRLDLEGKTDGEVLRRVLPEWEANVTAARAAVPEAQWEEFRRDAVRGAVAAVAAYLALGDGAVGVPGGALVLGDAAEPAADAERALSEEPAAGGG